MTTATAEAPAEVAAEAGAAEPEKPAKPPKPPTDVIVYRFGTPSWIVKELDSTVDDQVRLGHDLRETLVSLEHAREDDDRALLMTHPPFKVAEEKVMGLEKLCEELAAVVSAERARLRTRHVNIPEVESLAAAQQQAKDARVARRLAAKETRKLPHIKEATARAREKMKADIKALYADFVQERGMYWAHYNDVVDHHRVSVARVIKMRMNGRPVRLRHHHWDGSGALAVQLQRGAKQPPRSPATIADKNGTWRNVLRLPWMDPAEFNQLSRARQRFFARSTFTMRVGDKQVTLPVIVHRMLPANADITGARLVVERIAAQKRYSLHVVARVPKPARRESGPVIAVHGGWRATDDEYGTGVQAATWRASEPVTVPENLRDIVHADTPTSGFIRLPESWLAKMERAHRIASERDLALDKARDALVEKLKIHAVEGLDPAEVARWRSPARFAGLALAWLDNPPSKTGLKIAQEMADELESWRAFDKKLWETQEHGRRKHLGRRDDAWKRVASWVGKVGGMLVIDDTDYAAITRTSAVAAKDDAAAAATRATVERQRRYASPGALRERLTVTCKREGVHVEPVTSKNLSREHTCGYVHKEAVSSPQVCEGCNRSYDPDKSATVLMLKRATEASAAA